MNIAMNRIPTTVLRFRIVAVSFFGPRTIELELLRGEDVLTAISIPYGDWGGPYLPPNWRCGRILSMEEFRAFLADQ